MENACASPETADASSQPFNRLLGIRKPRSGSLDRANRPRRRLSHERDAVGPQPPRVLWQRLGSQRRQAAPIRAASITSSARHSAAGLHDPPPHAAAAEHQDLPGPPHEDTLLPPEHDTPERNHRRPPGD